MTKVVGVRFRQVGKIYFFAPGKYSVETGQHIIVETARGVEYGQVVLGEREVEDTAVIQPLKAIIRIATPEDDERELKNREKEKEAFKICLEKIAKHNLDMKLIKAEYTFDNNKVLFYFTADGRIDFRDLVKELASIFKTRIELRQIGPRDKAKEVGGLGPCGRPLCCSSYLYTFDNITINMAKNQNIALNPNKINGACGRLLCCLSYEDDTYSELKKDLPKVGDIINKDGISGKVISVDVIKKTYRIETKDKEIIELS